MNLTSRSTRLAGVLFASGFLACVAQDSSKGSEEEIVDGKADALSSAVDHGALALSPGRSTVVAADISAKERLHSWSFTLSDQAEVALNTQQFSVMSPRELDTVLYLYRQRADGSFGHYIARNDDAAYASESGWSELSIELEAGTYRVLLKGYRKADVGMAALQAICTGSGCGEPTDYGEFSCESLLAWAKDGGCEGDDEYLWESCLSDTPWGNVKAKAAACCNDDLPYSWCN